MSLPLSFGAEFEFLCGFYEYKTSTENDVNPLGKTLRPKKIRDVNSDWELMYRDIAQTIYDMGVSIDPEDHDSLDYSQWTVKDDGSVNPQGAGFLLSSPDPLDNIELPPWPEIDVELVTPILPFNEASLQLIEKVLARLDEQYYLRVNTSCGLHVHIGHYNERFPTPMVKKIAAFLYTFDHQLSSIHPSHRLKNSYAMSLREHGDWSQSFQERHGVMPHPAYFTNAIMSKRDGDILGVREKVKANNGFKDNQYNFGNQQNASRKITIEFRGAAGTLDGRAATNWVRVIAALIRFCEDGDPVAYTDLLTNAHKAEKCEYMANHTDDENLAKHGPVLAHEGFTIVDLLMFLNEPKLAKYYRNFNKDIPESHEFMPQAKPTQWEYEKLDFTSAEYKAAHEKRREWERIHVENEVRTVAGMELREFVHDGEGWPMHKGYKQKQLGMADSSGFGAKPSGWR